MLIDQNIPPLLHPCSTGLIQCCLCWVESDALLEFFAVLVFLFSSQLIWGILWRIDLFFLLSLRGCNWWFVNLFSTHFVLFCSCNWWFGWKCLCSGWFWPSPCQFLLRFGKIWCFIFPHSILFSKQLILQVCFELWMDNILMFIWVYVCSYLNLNCDL